MSSSEKLSPTTQSCPNPSLPYDLILSCIARVSRLYYPTLSLVSKSFRSLLVSPELYKVRSLLDKSTESVLYVCLKLYPSENPSWFTLCRKKHVQTLTNIDTERTNYVLAKVQQSPPTSRSNIVAVGHNIYNIGGSMSPSSSVWILDCRYNTWREAPSLRVKLTPVSASVLDGKIYVSGIYRQGDLDSLLKTVEVFDTKANIWDSLSIPCSEIKRYFTKIHIYDGKLHVVTHRVMVAYNSKESRWDLVEHSEMKDPLFYKDSYCEIENVLYTTFHRRSIQWYDTKANKWMEVKGLVGLPKFPFGARVRLADYGGKMAVFWDEYLHCTNEKKIWCAEVKLERSKSCEIWGTVEWFDHVLTVPKSYEFVKALNVTV